ncbi:glycosyltransferase [Mycobacterium branderi]|uniref:Glycosyl transferase family 1 n=1 Tax=Mycobacterium branderi TaxID=43348 RepID=A0A7I7WAZ4_9MYCO|nr:glycosyltransferase [Mycobacterium branderi]MCV7235117.1 glycosyltransferase [Mycobacterium branderi]ORA33416.1 glycosyl transferase family 1 [Mycobacterium branderi]BBZ13008.1 glycosyltransferase [Mycobacterium branderi]
MKIVVASYGTRGDIEPNAAVARELMRRGHEVRVAVPSDLVGFAESLGFAAVAYGPDAQASLDVHHEFWTCFFRSPWRIPDLIRLYREAAELLTQCWEEATKTLVSLAEGADLLFTGLVFERLAANVAEYHDIPLATLHYNPKRVNGQLLPFLPAALNRSLTKASEWMVWRASKKLEDTQRRELGLPTATCPAPQRISERGSLEIQAYEEVCFPGLAAEWAKWKGQRPFVGTLTMELPTDADDEVLSWIAAGTPPIYFGFGSITVKSSVDTVAMISAVCAELGERALVCSGRGTDFSHIPHQDHVKVVDNMNHSAIFPACRAVVHHGGAGTTAAGLRAGVPQLMLWTALDQMLRGAAVKRLDVAVTRRISGITQKSLLADLRRILAPDYGARAREIATRVPKPAESVAAAADAIENFAHLRRVG